MNKLWKYVRLVPMQSVSCLGRTILRENDWFVLKYAILGCKYLTTLKNDAQLIDGKAYVKMLKGFSEVKLFTG